MAKEGSTIGGLMDCFGTAVSMSLQYGVPLEVYVNKFSHTRFEPMGHTKNPDIRIAKSIVDYIFRWLGITFLPGYREAMQGHATAEGPAAGEPPDRETRKQSRARRHEGRRAEPAAKDRPPRQPPKPSRPGPASLPGSPSRRRRPRPRSPTPRCSSGPA